MAPPTSASVALSSAPDAGAPGAPVPPRRVVVLGGGNAAGYFVKEWLAMGGVGAELLIVGEEPVVSYERPALSKGYLTAGARLPGFHTCVGGGGERQDPAWYGEHGVTFLTSAKVVRVDLEGKALTLASGGQVAWTQALVVATGAKAVLLSDFNTPGAELEGVLPLRSEQDASALAAAIKATKDANGQAVVVGGGYIGIEVAAALTANALPTTIVSADDRLLKRMLTAQLASFYEKAYEDKGVQLLRDARLVAIHGKDGKVSGVEVQVGGETRTLPASLVVVGVGARPNVELFTSGAGALELAPAPVGGIKVDGHFRTSAPGVYAVGDVAAFPQTHTLPGGTPGALLGRQEHVTNARASAAHAARHILGKADKPYEYVPYFYSRVFSLNMQFWGLPGDATSQVVHFEGDEAATKPGAFWVWGGKVVGVFLESCTPEQAAAAKKVAAAQPLAPADLGAQGLTFLMANGQ